MKNPGFDPSHDFVPVAGFASFVNAFALSSGTPAKGLEDYVAWVRTQGQGKGVVGVPAPGQQCCGIFVGERLVQHPSGTLEQVRRVP